MTPKTSQTASKTSHSRSSRKTKGATETARLFIDTSIDIRRTQSMRLSRYVE